MPGPRDDQQHFVHAITRDGLLSRLEPLVVEARTILDLGSAAGATGRQIRKRFHRAHVVSLDISAAMLATARRRRGWFSKASVVQADASRLPFAEGSFDVVVANQLLPWLPEPDAMFAEVARVLRKDGVFTFATLGPCNQTFASLADMHDVGDGLVRAGLRDPVLDIDRLTVNYEDASRLQADLQGLGPFAGDENATDGDKLSLELELVYGHCWGGGPRPDPSQIKIDAGRIPLRR